MHRIGEHYDFICLEMVQQLRIGFDDRGLFLRIKLTRHRLWLAMLHAEAMQQCDQPRAALELDAACSLDLGADLAGRPRQRRGDPAFSLSCCSSVRRRSLPSSRSLPDLRARLPHKADTRCGSCRHPATAPWRWPRSSCRRPAAPGRSPSGKAMGRRPVPSKLGQVLARFAVQEAAADHANGRIRVAPLGKALFAFSARLYRTTRHRRVRWRRDPIVGGEF